MNPSLEVWLKCLCKHHSSILRLSFWVSADKSITPVKHIISDIQNFFHFFHFSLSLFLSGPWSSFVCCRKSSLTLQFIILLQPELHHSVHSKFKCNFYTNLRLIINRKSFPYGSITDMYTGIQYLNVVRVTGRFFVGMWLLELCELHFANRQSWALNNIVILLGCVTAQNIQYILISWNFFESTEQMTELGNKIKYQSFWRNTFILLMQQYFMDY